MPYIDPSWQRLAYRKKPIEHVAYSTRFFHRFDQVLSEARNLGSQEPNRKKTKKNGGA